MDAVRETVARLKGTIEVKSEIGRGSRVILRLPLTLAIIKVLLVRAGGEVFALPIDVVSRTIARPQSYGVLSVLWASLAQESASSMPRARWRNRGDAHAQRPKAPSTCTQASCRRAIGTVGHRGRVPLGRIARPLVRVRAGRAVAAHRFAWVAVVSTVLGWARSCAASPAATRAPSRTRTWYCAGSGRKLCRRSTPS